MSSGYSIFMGTTNITILALFLVGCSSTHQSGSVTREQATAISVRLANDKASTLYHCQPFRESHPAQMVAGRWRWAAEQGLGRGDIEATVELAADGSAQRVEVQLLDNQGIFP